MMYKPINITNKPIIEIIEVGENTKAQKLWTTNTEIT
jgi:hypothetical protein